MIKLYYGSMMVPSFAYLCSVGKCHDHDVYDIGVMDAIKRSVDFKVVKCCLIASPAFIKNDFFTYMMEQASKDNVREIIDNKSKFLLCHASSGFKYLNFLSPVSPTIFSYDDDDQCNRHALNEVLADETVAARIESTKAFGEVKALNEFFSMLNTEPDRAYYGFDHCRRANTDKAVATLMVSDGLFRSSDLKERASYVALVEAVRENGGDVHVFSAQHVSGQRMPCSAVFYICLRCCSSLIPPSLVVCSQNYYNYQVSQHYYAFHYLK
jgi:protein pelota